MRMQTLRHCSIATDGVLSRRSSSSIGVSFSSLESSRTVRQASFSSCLVNGRNSAVASTLNPVCITAIPTAFSDSSMNGILMNAFSR